MDKVKILQIIPAPAGMRAVHEFDGKETEIPIVSLALVEEPGISAYVVAMEMLTDGSILIAENEPSFMFILFDGGRIEKVRKEDLEE